MSLINEALKKAQKQRTGETPEMPAVGGESAARIARRGQPAGFNSLILRLSLGVVALAVVITGAVLIMRRPVSAPVPTVPPAATTATATPTATASKPVEPASVSAPVTTPDTTVSLAVPAASPAAPAQSTPAVTAPVTVVFTPVDTPKPVDPAPIQLAPAPPKPLAKLDPRAINFINSIRVAGIRASVNDSKVLMNDRVYRVGNIVEAEMGLKLVGITPSSLTFEDENGAQFTRVF